MNVEINNCKIENDMFCLKVLLFTGHQCQLLGDLGITFAVCHFLWYPYMYVLAAFYNNLELQCQTLCIFYIIISVLLDWYIIIQYLHICVLVSSFLCVF